MTSSKKDELFVYIGSYTNKDAAGIHVYAYNVETGMMRLMDSIPGIAHPSFLTVDSKRKRLYAVSEVMEYEGIAGGSVAAYAVDPNNGKLTKLNEQPTHGAAPCYISMDQSGSCLLVANYAGGNVALFPIGERGEIEEASHVIQHQGSGIVSDRQEGPHAHSISADPSNRFAISADLGIDKLAVYKLDMDSRKFLPHGEVKVQPGAGPRHLAFHPNGEHLYVINELNSTVTVFSYDSTGTVFKELQTISALPEGYDDISFCADIHVHPSGRFLYGSNRGHDSIVIFGIDAETGQLTLVDHEPTRGNFPRNFALSPDGKYLLTANQLSDTIVTYLVDDHTGRLQPTGQVIQVCEPVCIQFADF